jgi:opacity protein-like surface antigen
VTTTIPNDRFGWVVGVGGEVRVSGNWLARLEYLHYEFGTSETATVVTQNVPGSFTETNSNQKIDVVRAGVSYKF